MSDIVTRSQLRCHPGVTPTPASDAVTVTVTDIRPVTGDAVTVTEGAPLLHDLTHLPGDVRRAVTSNTAAILREVWQSWPKTLTTDTEEEPDER